MMRRLIRLVLTGCCIVAAVPAGAATTAYGEAFDTLYRIDLDSRTAERVGAAGRVEGSIIGNISGLTSTVESAPLFAVSGARKLLLRIDTATGAATVVGSLGLEGQGDPANNDALDLNMIAGCDGKLWLSSAWAQKLWTVDSSSGRATLVGAMSQPISGLATRNGELYGASGKNDNRFYRIDPATGRASVVGSFGPAVTRWVNSVSMSFAANGTLYAVFNYMPPERDNDAPVDWSDLGTIDPATGKVTLLGPITGPASLRQIGIRGFTTGPAPCGVAPPPPAPGAPHADALAAPTTSEWALILLMLGLVGIASRQARAFAR